MFKTALFRSIKGSLFVFTATCLSFSISCSSDNSPGITTVDLNIGSASGRNNGTSYSLAKTDLRVNYFSLNAPNAGTLRDAVAYLDANGDGLTDVFMATGEFQSMDEFDCILALNNGSGGFTSSTVEFGGNMPKATHARKSISCDFNNDGLLDIFVFDHGFDSNPFPGNNPKLIIQESLGAFTWSKLTDQTGFHHGGAAADIDNDGDMDIFVGGFEPFFYINDGNANFTMVEDRFDRSIGKIFTAELIDVDEDGFVDLLVGAHEQDGDQTSIYWGSTTGSYTSNQRTVLPAFVNYGTVLDFEAEDIDGDNDRDLIINRTGGGNSNFYVGRRVQLVENTGGRSFSDITNQITNPGEDFDVWFPWLTAQDIDQDGDIDFYADDIAFGITYINDGSGNFTLE